MEVAHWSATRPARRGLRGRPGARRVEASRHTHLRHSERDQRRRGRGFGPSHCRVHAISPAALARSLLARAPVNGPGNREHGRTTGEQPIAGQLDREGASVLMGGGTRTGNLAVDAPKEVTTGATTAVPAHREAAPRRHRRSGHSPMTGPGGRAGPVRGRPAVPVDTSGSTPGRSARSEGSR